VIITQAGGLVRSAFCSILTESAPVDSSPRNKKAREEVRLFLGQREDYVLKKFDVIIFHN
jgi:hypothetical protein